MPPRCEFPCNLPPAKLISATPKSSTASLIVSIGSALEAVGPFPGTLGTLMVGVAVRRLSRRRGRLLPRGHGPARPARRPLAADDGAVPADYRLRTRPAVLQGRAGSGKMTVAHLRLLVDPPRRRCRPGGPLAGADGDVQPGPERFRGDVTGAARYARAKLAALLLGHDVRIGHNKEFSFSPGVSVTNVRQVMGLEFDGVIVVEPGAQAFPDSEQGRRWLYTVVTRAKRLRRAMGFSSSPRSWGRRGGTG